MCHVAGGAPRCQGGSRPGALRPRHRSLVCENSKKLGYEKIGEFTLSIIFWVKT